MNDKKKMKKESNDEVHTMQRERTEGLFIEFGIELETTYGQQWYFWALWSNNQ